MGKKLLLWKSLSILLILPLLLNLASPGKAKAWGAVESPAAWFTWTPPVNTHIERHLPCSIIPSIIASWPFYTPTSGDYPIVDMVAAERKLA